LAEAAAPSDSVLFLGAVYKYTYLLTVIRYGHLPSALGHVNPCPPMSELLMAAPRDRVWGWLSAALV